MSEERSAVSPALARPAEEYLGAPRRRAGARPNTLAAYRRDLDAYLVHLAARGVLEPDGVTRADIEAFIMARTAAGYAESSTNRALSAVKGFHRFMQRGADLHDLADDGGARPAH